MKALSVNCTPEKSSRSALHWAAHEGHRDCLEELIDKGADPNMQGEFSISPLHSAANAGQLHCVKALLENGAHLNVCDDDNQTPLHYVSASPLWCLLS